MWSRSCCIVCRFRGPADPRDRHPAAPSSCAGGHRRSTRAMATAAVVALAVAVVGSSWQLVAFAAPLLGVLVSVRWQRPAAAVRLAGNPDLLRCFEGEQVTLSVWATNRFRRRRPSRRLRWRGPRRGRRRAPGRLTAGGLRRALGPLSGRCPCRRHRVRRAAGRLGDGAGRRRVRVPGGPAAATPVAADRTARPARHASDTARRPWRRIRRHPHLRAR